MPAFSEVCAIWARRTSPFVSQSVLSGETNAQLDQTIDVSQVDPDQFAASARVLNHEGQATA